MKLQYICGMFVLCFFAWAVVVDNAIIPANDALRQDVGGYSRYRVKQWGNGGKLDVLSDELLVYAIVKNREQLYYMEYNPYLENSLKTLAPGTSVQLRYSRSFPKFWKRTLYDLRIGGVSSLRLSGAQLAAKQKEVWKFTGIMGGIFLFLSVIGLFNKPKRR